MWRVGGACGRSHNCSYGIIGSFSAATTGLRAFQKARPAAERMRLGRSGRPRSISIAAYSAVAKPRRRCAGQTSASLLPIAFLLRLVTSSPVADHGALWI